MMTIVVFLQIAPTLALAVSFLVWRGAMWRGSRRLRVLFGTPVLGPAVTIMLPAAALPLLLFLLAVPTAVPWLDSLISAGPWLVFAGLCLFLLVVVGDPPWLQPRWYREDLARRGEEGGERTLEALRRLRRTPEPSVDGQPLSVQRGAALTGEPDTYLLRGGRRGCVWVLEDRLVFRQSVLESFHRPDDLRIEVMRDDMEQVSVLRPERPGMSRPRLQVVTRAGETHTFILPDPDSAAAYLDGSRSVGAAPRMPDPWQPEPGKVGPDPQLQILALIANWILGSALGMGVTMILILSR